MRQESQGVLAQGEYTLLEEGKEEKKAGAVFEGGGREVTEELS